jgi:phosphate transport system substrate-binding protein
MKKLSILFSVLFVVLGFNAFAQSDKTILGAGATFPYPLYSKMFSEYFNYTGQKVNYQSIGSGGGIQQLTAKTIDFGASDAVLNGKQDSALSAPVVHIPITAGAVVICYNIPGVRASLKLTPAVLSDIFLGKITNWNDARIAADNKGIKLPNLVISVIRRSDGSGTTNIFTTYLSKVSAEWNSKVGKGSAVNWPTGIGGKGNEGVAGQVKQIPGAVGYVELAYAKQNNMVFATIQNKAGKFIVPSIESTTAAANVAIPDDAKVSLTNTDAPNGYPIAGFTWVLVYKELNYNGRDAAAAARIMKLILWMTHEGQQFCYDLNYAPLPKAAQKVADKLIRTVTYKGKPIIK